MKSICLCFHVHQPVRLRRFRFFDIGISDDYYDEYKNKSIIQRVARESYLPTNKIILKLIQKYQDRFKVAFSISGTAIDQFMNYAPEVIESFKELAATGCIEFIAETYPHSLAAIIDQEEFREQVITHSKAIETLFGKKPAVFSNTGLIYSDEIGAVVAELGFEAMIAEGPKQILKWRSPNYLYSNVIDPSIAILLRNDMLSDDIAFRFSNTNWSGWPLTAKKYVSWLKKIPKHEEIVNLFMDYETFGERQKADTGIFDFLESLPLMVFRKSDFKFMTPSEVVNHHDCISVLNMPHAGSNADQERDMSAWLGNNLQQEAFENIYKLSKMIDQDTSPALLRDWQYLQSSDHFYYMSTKYYDDGAVHASQNPYDSPYEAFLNYLNVLNDFSIRLDWEIKIRNNVNYEVNKTHIHFI